ncbi:MAG: FAD-dependent oxidoreductase [Verrucomicrobiota bacterium]
MNRFLPIFAIALAARALAAPLPCDVVIYGGTAAGIAAALQTKHMGKSVVVVAPEQHLGGLMASGLGWTDSGNKAAIGGLAREFFHRVWLAYQEPAAWRWQPRAAYGARGQGSPAIDGDERTMWTFEPQVAERTFEAWLRENAVPVHRNQWLERQHGVLVKDGRIVSITTLDGNVYAGKMFIDATYEGDLLAAAGVSFAVGREANKQYGESLNGVQVQHAVKHQFEKPVSAYVVAGDAASGLLARVAAQPPAADGSADNKVQAYCFRTCLTDQPDNRVAFAKPAGYDPRQYQLLARYLQAGWSAVAGKFDPIPNRKTDTNNHGAFSFDDIGMNYAYPEASYAQRREILREHQVYQQGLLWFVANDAQVPAKVRAQMSKWGLAKDEFADNGNWPYQIYVREARRMVGDFVVSEGHLTGAKPTPRPVGMGSYNMDSHHVQRYADAEGNARNEGDVEVALRHPYPVDYLAIVPKRAECRNLLVPVCVSASHIAYGSIRMEPVFMILGQSAATAAALALDAGCALQDLPYPALRSRLLTDGQVLECP